jgi:hypothetical protein
MPPNEGEHIGQVAYFLGIRKAPKMCHSADALELLTPLRWGYLFTAGPADTYTFPLLVSWPGCLLSGDDTQGHQA